MKSIFLSKTFWFNVLTGIVTIAAAFGYVPNSLVGMKVSAALIVFAPVVNIILRIFTTKQVSILGN